MLKNQILMEELNDHCAFCEQDSYRIIDQTENFTVWLSLGQIVEGYCLIMPNEHYPCMGALSPHLYTEYLELKDKVRSVLERVYGCCIFYEHGRVGVCDVKPGEQLCYHAHIHAVPVELDIYHDLKNDLVPYSLDSYHDIFEYKRKLGHYFFYEDKSGNPFIFQVNKPVRRQYLRYLVADRLGKSHLASWDEYPGWDEIHSAKEKLVPVFQSTKGGK